MEAVLYDFQSDLRAGLGLDEALTKHGINLKYAMDHLDKPQTAPKRRLRKFSRYGKNLYRLGNYYVVQKSIQGKTVNFGTYNSLTDARRVRDYMEADGWRRYKLDNILKELGIQRRIK